MRRFEWRGAVAAADFQHVAKAARGDQSHLRALAFNDGVDHHRRTMKQRLHRGHANAGFGDAIHDAAGELARRRARFRNAHLARLKIETDQVGKRSADVHTDEKRLLSHADLPF